MLKQVCIRVLSSVRAVNVFKKKSCGASPLNGENNFYIEATKGIIVSAVILLAIGILLRVL